MQWLEAALAFSIVMMLLSTVVSSIVELVQRVFRIRQGDLQSLAENIYSDVIEQTLKDANKSDIETPSEFAEDITKLRISHKYKALSERFIENKRLTTLPVEDFLARFASTKAGKAMYEVAARQGKEYLDIYLDNLVDRFEEYGEHTRTYFEKRASLVSCVVAILLAFLLNIHAINIFSNLVADPAMRSVIIAQGEDISRRITDIETSNKDLPFKKYIERSNENLEAYKQELGSLGIPIGWKEGFFKFPNFDGISMASHITTLFFTGILIGLGGPFWFNAYKKLFAITNTARKVVGLTKTKNEDSLAQKKLEKRPARDIFLTALKAKQSTIKVARPLLNKNGKLT